MAREGRACRDRRIPPRPAKMGQPVFLSRAETQRRREVFGRGGWTRLTRRKELFSRKERKGRKFFKNRDAPSPERAAVYSRGWSEAAPPGGPKNQSSPEGAAEGTRFLDRINRIYRISQAGQGLVGVARRRREKQRMAREGERPREPSSAAPPRKIGTIRFLPRAEAQRKDKEL